MGLSLNVILGSHCHVPFGTGDDEFERIYLTQLKPFIIALNKYPKIPAVLHYSGVLLHWVEKAHPEFFMLMKDLVSRKQVELLGGGFYEPLLSLLPQTDKIGQIEMLTTYLRGHFGRRPQGCWLPALVWEQNLTGVLNACGMGYTFLREEQFIQAGLSGEDLYAPCISEDQGKLITVFPLSNRIAADFTRERPSLVLEKFAADIPPGGERFVSLFPGLVSGAGSASGASAEDLQQRLFEEFSRCESFAEYTTPGRRFKGFRELKKAYFPNQMHSDSSPEEAARPPVHPRQFLINYPEANGIYSKMIYVNVLINQLRGDKSRKQTAREELWKAQSCDVFYSAESSGIYRNTIRNAAYRALLEAERITREKGEFVSSLMTFDFDLDGDAEYIYQGKHINCYIKNQGAGVFELDYLPKTWNYLDTFSPPRKDIFGYSPPERGCRRNAFTDLLAPEKLAFRDLEENGYSRFPIRFCGNERYELLELDKPRGKLRFRLSAKQELPLGSIEIEKIYQLKENTIFVRYLLFNRGNAAENFSFIPRLDFAFPGNGDPLVEIRELGVQKVVPHRAEIADAAGIEFNDVKNEMLITLNSGRPFDAWLFPVQSPCLMNGKTVDIYQSTCVMPVTRIFLDRGGSWSTEYSLTLTPWHTPAIHAPVHLLYSKS